MAKFCLNCGNANSEGAKVCSRCGGSLKKKNQGGDTTVLMTPPRESMDKKWILIGIVLIAAVVFFMTGNKRKIIGTWEVVEDQSMTFTFSLNGTVVAASGSYSDEGEYSIKGDILTIRELGSSNSGSFRMDISGKTMILSDVDDSDGVGNKVVMTKK